jgi:MOSC domain-containing protein YiiM
MSDATLISIQIAKPQVLPLNDGTGGTWKTAFFKKPITGPVRVGRITVDGDGQADLRYHGGEDRPILAYCAEHYPRWQKELGLLDMPPGGFGENFTISGLDERTVCLGDQYEIGPILVETSQPRQPCSKLARRWNNPELPKKVIAHNRGGWYFRVLREGIVEAGMKVKLLDRPYPQWTIARAIDVYYHHKDDVAAHRALATLEPLSEQWRSHFEKLLATGE